MHTTDAYGTVWVLSRNHVHYNEIDAKTCGTLSGAKLKPKMVFSGGIGAENASGIARLSAMLLRGRGWSWIYHLKLAVDRYDMAFPPPPPSRRLHIGTIEHVALDKRKEDRKRSETAKKDQDELRHRSGRQDTLH